MIFQSYHRHNDGTGHFQETRSKKSMKVRIVDNDEKVIWERGQGEGIACRSYVQDGTQEAIIDLLTEALEQANGQLICFNDAN
jgi:hypothetical protein